MKQQSWSERFSDTKQKLNSISGTSAKKFQNMLESTSYRFLSREKSPKSPRPPKDPPPLDQFVVKRPSIDKVLNIAKRQAWRSHLDEMLATSLTVAIGVTSGFVAVGPTFWVRYYGMTEGELLFLFLWTAIQSAFFSNFIAKPKQPTIDSWEIF